MKFILIYIVFICAFCNISRAELIFENHVIGERIYSSSPEFKFAFDFLTERAMGQLPDILAACLSAVKPGGVFIAFQGEHPQTDACDPHACGAVLLGVERYSLPCDDKKRQDR